jgi:hypothetical protein
MRALARSDEADDFAVAFSDVVGEPSVALTDLSLRPQFGAKIYELNGSITGLSSRRDTRSEVTLDGRVDEFGTARVRGQLNPFAASENTDLNVMFKNVDMVSASPYAMKFAGYQIAEGRISLDLQYKVRENALEGNNQIVLDNLTLGERTDSPDALQLPLRLALAILRDNDGRIELGLPVTGRLDDPQFAYGALLWKALGNVLSRTVLAPLRALGNLLGGGEQVETVQFEPSSAVLQPPEREKLVQVARLLSRRAQLKLSVPAQYSDLADGAALRERALDQVVAARAGIKQTEHEELALEQRGVRAALRALYAERFGAADLALQRTTAERAAAGPPPVAGTTVKADMAKTALPLSRRMGNLILGEPQVADSGAFYRALHQGLVQRQVLPADALQRLGTERADAILAALSAAGTSAASASATPPEKVLAEAGKPVSLKLALTAK